MVKFLGSELVEPVGYESMWQKFENEVYYAVKEKLEGKFKVEWQHEIRGLTPDVVVLLECFGCAEKCMIPTFIFDAFCKFKVEKVYFKKKDRQMKKYSKICDSILVMPHGYMNRPYCRSKDGKYHIISFHYLPVLLDCILEHAVIETMEDVCGYVPHCDSSNVYKQFELSIRSRVDRCPICNYIVTPISLIYCSKYDEHYYPDFLDYEIIEHGIGGYTYAECNGCGEHRMFGWNYDDCPFTSIEHMYQCKKCGAIFAPDTRKIITNFEEAHANMLTESFSYYEKCFRK